MNKNLENEINAEARFYASAFDNSEDHIMFDLFKRAIILDKIVDSKRMSNYYICCGSKICEKIKDIIY